MGQDFETMTWLRCVVDKTPEHYIVNCIVLFAKDRIREAKHFYVLGLLGWVIKKS